MNIKKLLITLFVFTIFASYINGDKNIAFAKYWPPTITAFTINGNATSITVAQGSTLSIAWTSANTSNCSATGGEGTTWNGNSNTALPFTRTTTGTLTTVINTGTSQVFTLTCINTLNISTVKSVTVNVQPTPAVVGAITTPTVTQTNTNVTTQTAPIVTQTNTSVINPTTPLSSTPVISTITPTSVAKDTGSKVTITGTGFTPTGNVVVLSRVAKWISNLSSNGTSITFTLPSYLSNGGPIYAGDILSLSVMNANGTSNQKTVKVIASSLPGVTTYTLLTDTAGTGAGTITGMKPTYTKWENAVLTAVPAVGSTFTGWSQSWDEACKNTTTTCSLVMSWNRTITANFTKTVAPPVTPPVVVPTTPTYIDPFENSSSYVLGLSTWNHITPFSGFGISTVVDSCNSYSNAMSDTEKIANLLKAQATKQINDFITASCPKTSYISSPTNPCVAKMYAIDNTLLSYTTYKAEGLKLKIDKAVECNPTTNKPTGADKKSWYNINLVNLSFITVRDMFYAKRYSTVTTPVADQIFFDLDKLLNVKFTAAVKYDKVIENTYVSADRTLRYHSINSFNLPRITLLKSAVGNLTTPTLSNNTVPFYIFGIADKELVSKEVGGIAFNSIQDYVTAFNTSSNRFGYLYSKENASLVQASGEVLNKLDTLLVEKIDKKLMAFGWDVDIETPTQTKEKQHSQLANVLNSIGNWFKGLRINISNFFTNLFGAKKVEAAGSIVPPTQTITLPPTGTATPGGSVWVNPYQTSCPEFYNTPIPKPEIDTSALEAKIFPMLTAKNHLDTTKKLNAVSYDFSVSANIENLRVLTPAQDDFLKSLDTHSQRKQKRANVDYWGSEKSFLYNSKPSNDLSCLSYFKLKDYRAIFLRFTSYNMNINVRTTEDKKGVYSYTLNKDIPVSDSLFHEYTKSLSRLYELRNSIDEIETQTSEMMKKIWQGDDTSTDV